MTKKTSPQAKRQKKQTPARILSTVLVAGGLLAVLAFVLLYYVLPQFMPKPPTPPAPSASSSALSSAPESASLQEEPAVQAPMYPVGKLVVVPERQTYKSGEMVLRIPRLQLSAPVMAGVDEELLKKSVGLYDYAQLPQEGNPNVSIAGHRDIYGREFYFIDTIAKDDLLYLDYKNKTYTYLYKDTVIIEADNWDPIRVQSYSCLTLTSCDPIGTSRNRIVVTAELLSVKDLETEELQ